LDELVDLLDMLVFQSLLVDSQSLAYSVAVLYCECELLSNAECLWNVQMRVTVTPQSPITQPPALETDLPTISSQVDIPWSMINFRDIKRLTSVY
jgi:hypothetical protein